MTPDAPILKTATKRDAQRQSVVEVLEEALAEAKAGKFNWCVLVADGDEKTARRWSSGANVHNVIAALVEIQFAIMYECVRSTENGL